jgi:hypothetical protein
MAANIGGCVLDLIGGVWALQGLNLLGGSFMTGQLQMANHRNSRSDD